MLPVRTAIALGVAVGLLATGCSNQKASVNRRPHPGTVTASVVDGVQQVTVSAGDTYRFDPSRIVVHPGRVRVVLRNDGKGAPHNWTLADIAATPLTPSGKQSQIEFTAPSPGEYTYVCTIHAKQGQTGTLVVSAN